MKKSTIILTLMFFVVVVSTKAQETVTTTGGEATGSGGTASYTVGQVVYTSITGTNGNTVSQGVQQPYEISVGTSIPEAKGITLQVKAYPNPTTDYLTVRVDASTSLSIQNLIYQVYDISGKLLQTVKATGRETKIEVNGFMPGSYFVKVVDNNKEIKTFKIIKR